MVDASDDELNDGLNAFFLLTVPNGSVQISAMGTGTVVWDNGEVTIDAIALEGEPIVIGGTLK